MNIVVMCVCSVYCVVSWGDVASNTHYTVYTAMHLDIRTEVVELICALHKLSSLHIILYMDQLKAEL